jgi:spore coat protein U-like protein
MRIGSLIAATVLTAVLPLAPAFAATSTTNMTVNIQIVAACTLSVTNTNFGTQTAASVAAGMVSTAAMGGVFTSTCPNGTSPVLTASQGANWSGTTNRMKGVTPTNLIPYSLAWQALPPSTGALVTTQITATLPVQAAPAIDTYTDSVVLTLTY